MPRKPMDVTDAELAVLEALWEGGSATIRELTDKLYPAGGESEYATVKKLLARLETKNCVARDSGQRVHVFAPKIRRGDLVGRRLQDVVDRLCKGSWMPLLTHLVEAEGLSPKQQQVLYDLIDELEKKSPSRKRK